MVFMPMDSPRPSSLSLSAGLKVAAWNISSWLMASEGTKLAPTNQGCFAYHALAASSVQRWGCWAAAGMARDRARQRAWIRMQRKSYAMGKSTQKSDRGFSRMNADKGY